ncbi:MAG: hypothetical protein ACFWUC_13880 [Oscillospiraceae bacterium]|jgi:hypothetical protein
MKENIILSNNFNPRGRIKIELFDAFTSKKVEEIKTHNFISAGVKNYLFKLAMKSLFTKNKYTGGEDIYDYINDPFQYMLLTDASHPEDPENEWLVRGEKIGYAYTNKTYSGSNEMQGSYNASESFTNNEQVRIVVDFPTHAANGTFQSIYFLFNGVKFNTLSRLAFGNRIPLNGDDEIICVRVYGDYIYVLYNSDNNKFVKYDMNLNLVEEYTLPYVSYNNGFEIHNGYVYFARGSDVDSYNFIWRAPLNDLSDYEIIVSDITYAGGIAYVPEKDQFVIAHGKGKTYLSRYDSSFNLLSTTETNADLSYYNLQLTYHEGDLFINNMILDSDDDTYIRWCGTGHSIVGFIGDKYVTSNGYLLPKVGISSRARLESPVTKTNTNTMKVTYDFIFE